MEVTEDRDEQQGIVLRMLETQGSGKQPGEEGYWEVWGACVSDIQQWDLVIMKFFNDDGTATIRQDQINALIPQTGIQDSIGIRYINHDGQERYCGRLVRVWVFRRMTHHILGKYVR